MAAEEKKEVPHQYEAFVTGNKLDLSNYHGNLTPENIAENLLPFLAQHPEITALTIIKPFGWRGIDTAGAILLATNQTLTYLNIHDNRIGDQGAIALAGHPTLKYLDASSSGISDKGAIALAQNPRLMRLNLNENWIRVTGATAFLKNKTLIDLDLGLNFKNPRLKYDLEGVMRENDFVQRQYNENMPIFLKSATNMPHDLADIIEKYIHNNEDHPNSTTIGMGFFDNRCTKDYQRDFEARAATTDYHRNAEARAATSAAEPRGARDKGCSIM
jgi:hypothetical protein